jgi:hypothetical protein
LPDAKAFGFVTPIDLLAAADEVIVRREREVRSGSFASVS